MPSAKAKFITKDGEPKRCPKNESQLRRIPECGLFDYNVLPFNPVNPPKPPFRPPSIPIGPTIGTALVPSSFKLNQVPMDRIRTPLNPNLIPAEKQPQDLPAVNISEYPVEDIDRPTTPYFKARRLGQDDPYFSGYLRRSSIVDMGEAYYRNQTYNLPATRRTMQGVIDRYENRAYRAGLSDIVVDSEIPLQELTRVEPPAEDQTGFADITPTAEPPPPEVIQSRLPPPMATDVDFSEVTRTLREVGADEGYITRQVNIERQISRDETTRGQRLRAKTAPMQTIVFDPTPDQLETTEEIPEVVNPFSSEAELETQVIIMAKRLVRRTRPVIDQTQMEQIYNKLRRRGVTREQVKNILIENGLYDDDFERSIQDKPRAERAQARKEYYRRLYGESSRQGETSTQPIADPRDTEFSTPAQPERRPRPFLSRSGYSTLSREDVDDPEEEGVVRSGRRLSLTQLGRRRGGFIPLSREEDTEEVRERDIEEGVDRSLQIESNIERTTKFTMRENLKNATELAQEGLTRTKEFTLSLADETNKNLRAARMKIGEALKSGYIKTAGTMQQLTQAELQDLERQLNALPSDDLNYNRTIFRRDIEAALPRINETDDPRPLLDADEDMIDVPLVDPTITRPNLTFKQRLKVARESFGDIKEQVSGGDMAAGGAGMLAAFGISALLSKTTNIDPYSNAAISGFTGDLTARVSTMVGNNIYQRVTARAGVQAGTEAVAESAGMVAVRTGTRLLAGGLEGAGVGVATLPLDILFNKALLNANLGEMKNAKADFLSAAASGTIATGAIGLISLGAAPETFGLSLAVGAAATLISSAISGLTGRAQDEKIQTAREDADNASGLKLQILQMMDRPDINYNFDKALSILQTNNPTEYNNLIATPDFKTFRTKMEQIFTDRPSPIAPSPQPPSKDPNTKRTNNLFSQAVLHDLIDRVCGTQSTDGCTKLRQQQPQPLTDDEKAFLTKQTNDTWEMSVRVIVEQSFQQMKGTQYRIGQAQQYLLDQWNTNQKASINLDSYYSQTAFLDPEFKTEYLNNIKIDAQNKVINAYYKDQTKLSDMSDDIQYAAEQDPDFQHLMTKFYSSMEDGARQLGLSPAQLVDLQTTPVADQAKKYEQMSFDNIKLQTNVVTDAQHLAAEQDKVPRNDYYDIDAVYLSDRDPTSYTKWNPSDSQILQANQSGLSLNEYIRYIHELAKGEDANFSDIKFDTPQQELLDKQTDIKHFKDELQLSGNPLNMYLYDTDTGTITRNPAVPNVPTGSPTEYVSQFRPQYVIQAQNEYAHMVQNLNEKTQAEVDDYNAKIRRQLSVFGANYDEMVAAQNDYIARNALTTTPLLAFNTQAYLNQYILHYNPLSENMPQTTSDPTSRQKQQTAGQIYTETGDSYLPIQNDNNGSVLDADKQAEVEYARSQGLTLDQYREAVRTMQVDYGDEENDGDWKRSELDSIMKHERETDNVTDITGDTTTIYTQTGKVIRRTKDGVDITDQTDPNDLADNLPAVVKDTTNTGVDPTDIAGQTRIQIGQKAKSP